MRNVKNHLAAGACLLLAAFALNITGVGSAAAQAMKDVIVANTASQPVPTTVQSLPPITGSVAITNTPSVSVVRNLVRDGRSFAVAPDPNIAFELFVPANVVLTDVVLSLNAPSLATTVFVQEMGGPKMFLFESVGSASSTWAGNTSGHAAIHLQSGVQGTGGLRVGITCNNIGGNSCAGALMWSGYQP